MLIAMGERLPRLVVAGLAGVLLSGCVASTPPAPSGTPGGASPSESLVPSGAQTNRGQLQWTKRIPGGIGPLRAIRTYGDIYTVAGLAPDSQTLMKQTAGTLESGKTLSTLAYSDAIGFPRTDPTGTVTTGIRSLGGVQAWAWDTRTGAKRWSQTVPAQGPRPFALVSGYTSSDVLVRPSAPDAGNRRETGLVALDQSTGQEHWSTPGEYQWRSVDPGEVVVATYREDKDRAGASDHVAFLDPADGSIITTFAWYDRRAGDRATGYALSGNDVLLMGAHDDTTEVDLATYDRSGQQRWHDVCEGDPIVDAEGQSVACLHSDGSLTVHDMVSGEALWSRSAAQMEATGLIIGLGGEGLFWGAAGADDGAVLDSRTGQPYVIQPLWGPDLRRWSGQVYLASTGTQLQAYTGSGTPIGTRPNLARALFMTRD